MSEAALPTTFAVAVDFDARSRRTLARAALLATEHGARLEVLNLVEPHRGLGALVDPVSDDALRRRAARLETLARTLAPRPMEVTARVLVGGFVPTLQAHLRAHSNISLLILGPHRPGFLRDLVSRTKAERLAGRVACPTLVVKDDAAAPYRRVLVTLDLGPSDGSVLDAARRLCPTAELTGLHVYDPPLAMKLTSAGTPREELADYQRRAEREARAALMAALERRGGDRMPLPALRRGDARLEITSLIADLHHDLVVIGRGGHVLTDLVLGSVSQHVLRRAHADVLVVPRAPASSSDARADG